MLMTRCPTVSGWTADKMIYGLSVKITALVRLPYVASIKLLLSLASCTIRLIGADSGETIEIILFAETTFPNPILISCKPKKVPSITIRRLSQTFLFDNAYITQYFELAPLFFQFHFLT